jgi:hypothetical protein
MRATIGIHTGWDMHSASLRPSFEVFLTVAAQLNRELAVVPVLYGSLGLSRAINSSQPIGDVDILVPAVFLAHRWHAVMAVMERLQFDLIDAREHEFRRSGDTVAFADQESLLPFAGINPSTLRTSTVQGVQFKELTPVDYLAVYRASQRDGYRQKQRGKRDAEKIKQIEQFLNQAGYSKPNT